MRIGRVIPSCVVAAALVTISCSSNAPAGDPSVNPTSGGGVGGAGGPGSGGEGGAGATDASTGGTSDGSGATDASTGATSDSGGISDSGGTSGDASVGTSDSGSDSGRESDAASGDHDSGAGGGGGGGEDAGPTDASDASSPVAGGSDLCTTATVISLSTPVIDLVADTTAAAHDIDAPCVADSGPDVFFQFSVSRRVMVYADTFGASWNTVLYLLSSNCTPITTQTTAGDAVCSDDACGNSQSQIVALLNPGNYRIGLGGSGGATGVATIHFEIALAASGTETELPQGVSTQSGTTAGASGNVDDSTLACNGVIGAGPEDGYWWASCPSDPGGQLSASTCGGASWETLLETEMPGSHPYKCSLDSCGLQTALTENVAAGAALHVLLVDGQAGNSAGAYTMQVTRP